MKFPIWFGSSGSGSICGLLVKADKEQHDSEVKRLAKEVTGHKADIEKYKEDQKKAT